MDDSKSKAFYEGLLLEVRAAISLGPKNTGQFIFVQSKVRLFLKNLVLYRWAAMPLTFLAINSTVRVFTYKEI